MSAVLSTEHAAAPAAAALYERCKRIANRQLQAFQHAPTLSATALVHEAYLRLAQSESRSRSDEHWLSLWARTMRNVLIDYCRARSAQKRRGEVQGEFEDAPLVEDPDALLHFEQRLVALESHDPRLARVLELRVYAGLETADIALELGVDVRTIQRDWLRARAWLEKG